MSGRVPKHIPNPAVALCMKAWRRAYNAEFAEDENEFAAEMAAAEAYRDAMPTLTDIESIHDFIACVAHGILIKAIENDQGTKLLYAAQVATGHSRIAKREKPSPSVPSSPAS